MSVRLPVGPYRMLDFGPESSVPWYMLPFDEQGQCAGPLTRDHLLDAVKRGTFSDIIIFSHGWNNEWQDAITAYEGFLNGYADLRRRRGLAYPRPYSPLLVGIFWPSTALVMPWERGPQIAADGGPDPQRDDAAVAQERREVQTLAQQIDPADRGAFYTLAQRDGDLRDDEARHLARIMLPFYREGAAGDLPLGASGNDAALTPDSLVATWRAMARRRAPRDTGDEGGTIEEQDRPPEAAGLLERLNPREIIRAATVWQMKDRAGVVGAGGVATMLLDLLEASATARLHLIGHSYGCKVVLSALCAPSAMPRAVNSVLLLQPAISHLCFAVDVPGLGQPGGYRIALERVEQPLLTTFSAADVPLHDLFHLAVRRAVDLGEVAIAGDEPPSRFAALGGYGPRGCAGDCEEIPIKLLGQTYDLGPAGPRLYALDGAGVIKGHGDISNEATWWALYNQLAQP